MNRPKLAEGVTLTTDEFHCLCRIAGSERPLGIPDPYRGWQPEEIALVEKEALHHLEKSGQIHAVGPGEYQLQGPAAPLLAACLSPRSALLTRVELPGGYRAISNFYWSEQAGVLVEVTTMEGSDQQHLLPLAESDLIYRLLRRFGWRGEVAPTATASRLPEAVLAQARSTCYQDGLSSGRAHLVDAGLARPVAAKLAEALVSPVSVGTIVTVVPDRQEQRAWTVIEGQGGLWWLSHYDTDGVAMIDLQGVTATEAHLRLRDLLVGLLAAADGGVILTE